MNVKIPNCMQLILQFGCSRLLFNEVPNNLYLLLCTRLKTLWVMEDKVASFVCNLMLNLMYASLIIYNQKVRQSLSIVKNWLTSIDGIKWVSEGSNFPPRSSRNRIWENRWEFIKLTLLVIYDDGLCSLCYTTNLLKDSCLASIGSSYDKNAKMVSKLSYLI